MPTILELLYEGNYVCTMRSDRNPDGGDLFELGGKVYYLQSENDYINELQSSMWAWC